MAVDESSEDAVGVAGLVPWTPGRGQSYEAALEAEVIALRAVVQELVRNDGGAPCWQEGSLAAQAFERAEEFGREGRTDG